ncbi:hypothetical protein OAU57_01445 [Candidatus Pelagibacter ubique]|jgi:hypothetical protein|nr:hypothetical protein [Candidatus Pelagibacter ubique]
MNTKFIILIFYFLFTVNAHAYLDPGTGSMILQLILGGVAAFFATISVFFSKIKSYIKKIFNSKNNNNKNINKEHE